MKQLSPTQIFRVSRHAPSPVALSPNKFLLPACSHTLFATFFLNSQLPSASYHLLCSAAQSRRTATPALRSIQFPYSPRQPPSGFLQVAESKARKHATLCSRLSSSRFSLNTHLCP